MLVIVREYRVKAAHLEDFEDLFREDGAWVDLFRAGPGFVSTTLMKDVRVPTRYVVADRWTSEEAYADLRRRHAARHQALDERCRRYIESETEIGRFDFLH